MAEATKVTATKARRRLQPDMRQEQILQTAMRLFADKGYDRTTIDDIADACGVAPGLIYHYFDSKAELLRKAMERYGFLETLRDILHRPKSVRLEPTLTEIAEAFWTMLQEKREAVLTMRGEMHRDPETAQALGTVAKEGLRLFCGYLRRRQRAGEVRPDADVEVAGRVFFSALMDFFVTQHRLSPPLKKLPPKRFISGLVRLIVHGLKPSP
ncbi:HTH-type transcriptional repressor KstR2 [bacterium HR17]|uniref:HTH-type transcriptional repressor KstR2 n=1 Tax=Candidatus Fervidibacter japonicus TaxID=2035412 RepID=A0A2H5XFC8_9BACT|nr:HTH-type transcriptional repressor KstR2 [bacterium HR17]